jgi:uncharacterized protein (DUF2141 family)
MSKRRSTPFIAGTFVAALPFVLFGQPAEAQETAGRIEVKVATFRNMKGTLNCSLYSDAKSFPDGAGMKTVRATIRGAEATCAFEGVAPGTYAIAVLHDENANGKIDKSFFGVPTEGYGVSNNRTYALSAPKWNESKFDFHAKEPASFRVSLRY